MFTSLVSSMLTLVSHWAHSCASTRKQKTERQRDVIRTDEDLKNTLPRKTSSLFSPALLVLHCSFHKGACPPSNQKKQRSEMQDRVEGPIVKKKKQSHSKAYLCRGRSLANASTLLLLLPLSFLQFYILLFNERNQCVAAPLKLLWSKFTDHRPAGSFIKSDPIRQYKSAPKIEEKQHDMARVTSTGTIKKKKPIDWRYCELHNWYTSKS